MIPGSNGTVTIEHLAQSKDPHGASIDGAVDSTAVEDAMIARASLGNLWKMTVSGDYGEISLAPSEWRITDGTGNVYAPVRATHRPPIEQLGETAHTLIFAELQGEPDMEVEV